MFICLDESGDMVTTEQKQWIIILTYITASQFEWKDLIIQWVKTMTTNDYIRGINERGWERFNGKLWQRNYYEHIIRDEKELTRIREYIIHNPLKWTEDENNPANIKAVKWKN